MAPSSSVNASTLKGKHGHFLKNGGAKMPDRDPRSGRRLSPPMRDPFYTSDALYIKLVWTLFSMYCVFTAGVCAVLKAERGQLGFCVKQGGGG